MKSLVLILSILVSSAISVSKAEASSIVNGITVSPAIQQISLNKDQTTDTFSTTVTNNTSLLVSINVGSEDFTALNQSGGLSFFNNGQSSNNPHSLVNYLDIVNPHVTLAAGQSQNVPITIVNANKLATGGHYAAIMFKLTGVSGLKGNEIGVNQIVSSLVFLSTYGQGTQTTNLINPVVGSILTKLPSSITVILENSGNTQTTPRGLAQIINSSSRVVSQGQINVGSGLILPQSKRLFTVNLSPVAKHFWMGTYRLKISYRHDGQAQYSVYVKKFIFINQTLLTIILVVVFLLLCLAIRKFSPKSIYYIKK